MAEAEHFAITDYLTTLAGPSPTGDAAKAFYGTVARMTGLPIDAVARTRGRVSPPSWSRRAPRGEIASLYDGGFTAPNPFPESLSGRRGADPVLDGFSRALSGAFAGYARANSAMRPT